MSVDLTGAADLHCHFGPDPHRERSVDAFEAAREAHAARHRARRAEVARLPHRITRMGGATRCR